MVRLGKDAVPTPKRERNRFSLESHDARGKDCRALPARQE